MNRMPFACALTGALLVSATLLAEEPRPRDITAEGLSGSVRIEVDALGAPRILAETRTDAAFALGFMHGRERFFQMDLSRRYAAGRLSEIAGEATLGQDEWARTWNFARVAQVMLDRAPQRHIELLEHYAAGVNEGLASLPALPAEYLLAGGAPEAWTPTDSVLASLSLVDNLSHGRWPEDWHAAARHALPDGAYAFFHPRGDAYDAPIIAGEGFALAPLPSTQEFDLRSGLRGGAESSGFIAPVDLASVTRSMGEEPVGSNNWAVASGRTAAGGAILASDPHLMFSLPGTWYRAELNWVQADGTPRRTVGATLPGLPVVVMGSNGDLAWGMTNVEGDFEDGVVIAEAVETTQREERILVRGMPEPKIVTYTDTPYGPVVDESDPLGRRIASRWTGAIGEASNLMVFDLAEASTLEKGLEVAASWHSAPQNVVFASADGRVGWTISGYIPVRIGYDGSEAMEWAPGRVGWAGHVGRSSFRPILIRDGNGFVHSANSRTLPPAWSGVYQRYFPTGTRAQRIADQLGQAEGVDEADMLALQLDTRAALLDPVRGIVLDAIPEETTDETLAEVRALVSAYSGHADADEPAHELMRTLRYTLINACYEPLKRYVSARTPEGVGGWSSRQAWSVTLRLIEEEPMHLLDPAYDSWGALVEASIRRAATQVRERAGGRLGPPWGEMNRARIQHPLADLVGSMLPGLKAPDTPLAGDSMAVRVMRPGFGASMRLVVEPGAEERGLFQMPGGQSGRPGTPAFMAGHEDWLEGRPAPLLPGEAVRVWRISPATEKPEKSTE